jgi:NAD(P)-dependent dehydrogenase (short-subunit alcohol dehydrogenase family)
MAVVLVTGGSSGIGLAIVRRLAASGDRVFAASRNPARSPLPAGVTPIAVDVADPAAGEVAISTVMNAAGRLDVLVNNAGAESIAPLEEAGDAEAHRIFEVNVFGPMRLVRAAIPVMRAQGGGRILNVSSINDIAPAPFGGWYSASKAALTSLTAVLDAEVRGFGILVTAVAPGLFRTAMAERLSSYGVGADSPYAAIFRALGEGAAAELDEAGDPDEVARAVEDCIRAADPPARLLIGADAVEMEKTARGSSPEELAALLRKSVADLTLRRTAGPPGPRDTDDDQRDERQGDEPRHQRADPVEALGGRQRDGNAVAGHDLLFELAFRERERRAKRVRHGGASEGDGQQRRADGHPGEVSLRGPRLRRRSRGADDRQVGQRDPQLPAGAGGQRLAGPLVQLLGRDPPGLVGLAQLGQRPVAVGVGHPQIALGKSPRVGLHRSVSLVAPDIRR